MEEAAIHGLNRMGFVPVDLAQNDVLHGSTLSLILSENPLTMEPVALLRSGSFLGRLP